MFIHLTMGGNGWPVVVNSAHIVAFGPSDQIEKYPELPGRIVMTSGIMYVQETPEQIASLLDGPSEAP